ncbi:MULTISPECIES: GGDEF domain-containing protein [Pseudoalteromonas]|uniref:diguanylate cyclase n=1 Tax=Pseudoalteromonas amylolytica TaxID=1859457 RepID=A0A1S1MTA7_9GAMM|nr:MULTISPECIES: GGDEF domain-containing protein [Pseudoalteromonas]OHU84315.1 deoxycytidine triphosphate deaminase [Pseudoalteromonas sp. JW3]OHU87146.1 deoxycytidine triphosphate deaminase [Pseudoalteromonas amylolytica]
MIDAEQMTAVLAALPDPAFLISRNGRYVAIYGGQDERYYHDGSSLVGQYISDIIKPDKAAWFIATIERALASKVLLIEEYELSNKDVNGLPDEGPSEPIWFEGRIKALDFKIDNEDVVLWVASNISQRHELETRLRAQSDTDQLTGLFNRRRLKRELSYHFNAFRRHGYAVSLLMFDLDHLKLLNDTCGHHAGDSAIRKIAQICTETLRQTDITCRFGGDEFVVVLPHLTLEHATVTAERIRTSVEQALLNTHQLHTQENMPVSISISIGVTQISPQDGSYEQALKRADSALYQAKRGGRNQVVTA